MKIFLVAGEASGDRLGAALMAGMRSLRDDVAFTGVGGPRMQAQGMRSLFAMDELSVMGITEILPRYTHLRRRMVETAEAVLAEEPDILLTIDSPDFCLRVAARVRRARRIRTVHYVAPSVWAWRTRRAERMAPHVDQVLALLPFEPPYMEAAGMRCDFVGHPVAAEPRAGAEAVAALRATLGGGPVVLALPGSRRSEVTRLAPVFGAALSRVARRHPGLRVVVPAAEGLAPLVEPLVRDWPAARVVDAGDADLKAVAFGAADVALAASGTVSLELAATGTPMVVAYDMSWLSWQVMSRMARIDTVTLVNLIEGRPVVPEFLGPACRPGPIADALVQVAAAPGEQGAALDRTMAALGRGGPPPGLRAARAVLDGLREARS